MYLADCLSRTCEWDMLCKSEEFGRMLETLHMIKRHPDEYRSLLGKDPEEAARLYHQQMKEFGVNV